MTSTTRPHAPSFVRAAFAVTLALLSAGAAQAAPDDLQRVEITGRRPGEMARTDVRASCPGIDQALAEQLAKAQYRSGTEGVSTVSFRLNGSTISEVSQSRGPWIYRQPLSRAVSSLQCQGPARDTLYVMQVSFRNSPAAEGTDNRVALLEMAPPAAGAASASLVDGR